MSGKPVYPVDRDVFYETIGPIQARLGKLETALAAISQESDESEDTQRSETSQPVLPGELVEAVREMIGADFEVQLNGLRKDGSTQPSSAAWRRFRRAVVRIQAALASLPDPLPTVESVRAEYLAELIKRADDQCAKITDSSPLIVREALNASCWLRSQKGEG